MLQINNNQITLTQGDTAEIEITIFTADADLNDSVSIEEQIYTMQENDVLKFVLLDINRNGMANNRPFSFYYDSYINQNYRDFSPVLIKEFNNNIIKIDSRDSLYINTGVYLYGVVLEKENGIINTIQQGEFILRKGFT